MIDEIRIVFKKEEILLKFNLLFYKNERWDSRVTQKARKYC